MTQRHAELHKLATECELLRSQFNGTEKASLGLLAGYVRQLEQLTGESLIPEGQQDLAMRLFRGIETERAKLANVHLRRRELLLLEHRLYALLQQIDAPERTP